MRNLASTVTEEILEKAFSQFGKLERVKKLKDYAFIHFEERDGAVKVWTRKNPYKLFSKNFNKNAIAVKPVITLITFTGFG